MDKSFFVDVTIDIAVERDVPSNIADAIKKVTRLAWHKIDMGNFSAELSMLLTTDAQVSRLNKDYRNKDKPTNVIAVRANASAAIVGPTW